jgi:hypothetical protein
MKYNESDLQSLTGIDVIRRRPDMYAGPGWEHPERLASGLVDNVLLLGASQVEVHHVGEWWIVSSDDDWLAYHNQLSVSETFERLLPIPLPHLVNSCRFEAVVYALADAVFTAKGGELLVLKGDEAEVRLLLADPLLRRLEEKRTVGFTMMQRRAETDAHGPL